MKNNQRRQSPRTKSNRHSHEDIWTTRLDIIYRSIIIYHAMSTSGNTAGLVMQHLEVMLRTAAHLLAHIF